MTDLRYKYGRCSTGTLPLGGLNRKEFHHDHDNRKAATVAKWGSLLGSSSTTAMKSWAISQTTEMQNTGHR